MLLVYWLLSDDVTVLIVLSVDDAVIDIDMTPSGDHVIDMTGLSSLAQSTVRVFKSSLMS